jgi:hypothetical protein
MKLALFLLLPCSSMAFASVGENYDALELRLGKGEKTSVSKTRPNSFRARHETNGVEVSVLVFNGIIVTEQYSPVTKLQAEGMVSLQLKARFQPIATSDQCVIWRTEDQNHSAIWTAKDKRLLITTRNLTGSAK